MKSARVQFFYRLNGLKVARIKPLAAGRGGKAPLLPRTLVVEPGVYRVRGREISMEKEGLYRFFFVPGANIQRIAYRKDAEALISGLCWTHSHGSRDDFKAHAELCRTAMVRKLVMTCGPFSNFVSRMLNKQGIETRVVGMTTLLPPNGWSDGHVTMEVKCGGKWTVLDPDPHAAYSFRGRRLSLAGLIIHVMRDDYKIERLANSYDLAVSDFHNPMARGDYDYGLLSETSSGGMPGPERKGLRKGLKRVCMVPRISEGGHVYSSHPDERTLARARKRHPSFKFLGWDEFIDKFYP